MTIEFKQGGNPYDKLGVGLKAKYDFEENIIVLSKKDLYPLSAHKKTPVITEFNRPLKCFYIAQFVIFIIDDDNYHIIKNRLGKKETLEIISIIKNNHELYS